MKNIFLPIAIAALAVFAGCGRNSTTAMSTGTSDSVAYVHFHNTSGRPLVIALEQGALAGQNVAQLAWLRKDTANSYHWQVPATPSSNADLRPYIFDLPVNDTLVIPVPQYAAAVGFRCLVADTAYRHNAMQPLNTSDSTKLNYMAFPDLQTATYVFDKFEAGLTINNPGIWNITAVDFVALPMQLSMGSTKVGFKNGVTFAGLQQLLNQLPSPYSTGGSIAPNTATSTYRFFSPSHISMGNALDYAIDSTVAEIPHFTDTVAYGNYTFFGFSASQTSSSPVTATVSCSYTNTAMGVTSATAVTVNDVTTANAFAGTIVGATASGNTQAAQTELGAILSAAICRGVGGYPAKWGDIVHTATNCSTPWNYYPSGQQSNAYSQLIHSYSINNKNYGFPYDDYFGDEAGFTAVAGNTIHVTILPYSGTMTAQPNPPALQRTGCLVVTVPAGTIYPSGSGWQIGPMNVGNNAIMPGANPLCELNSDTVTCTFASFPAYKMKIYMGATSNSNAVTFWENNAIKQGMNITGMVYSYSTRTLTFGQSAAWTGQ